MELLLLSLYLQNFVLKQNYTPSCLEKQQYNHYQQQRSSQFWYDLSVKQNINELINKIIQFFQHIYTESGQYDHNGIKIKNIYETFIDKIQNDDKSENDYKSFSKVQQLKIHAINSILNKLNSFDYSVLNHRININITKENEIDNQTIITEVNVSQLTMNYNSMETSTYNIDESPTQQSFSDIYSYDQLTTIMLDNNGIEEDEEFPPIAGVEFHPIHPNELLSIMTNIKTSLDCFFKCKQNRQCRTFDYDRRYFRCRLFEGSMSTGFVIDSTSLTIAVGELDYNPKFYEHYNKTCDHCQNSHFLECINDLCLCPKNTFWNDTICVNQFYVGANCSSDDWCRKDLDLICSIDKNICSCQNKSLFWNGIECLTYFQCLHLNISTYQDDFIHYTCNYTATTSFAVISFTFRNDYHLWILQNIQILNEKNENLIINGDFQTDGGWNVTNNYSTDSDSYGTIVTFYKSMNFYIIHAKDYFYQLNQTFKTIPEQSYRISFLLKNNAAKPTAIASVSVIPQP
ncbi:unnamed protein product [Didymodactylos carnosus]|uniref:Apple domain-containing protein n=1 Tax=Didymodactylos carnosus TaxID=1234261 RepID=A0A8S2ELB5_9BILA|nr:unnamed protein product [Didymodactylos carnosus]CAF3986594.1 unnamed protein product [Didymodactylos carnosus]